MLKKVLLVKDHLEMLEDVLKMPLKGNTRRKEYTGERNVLLNGDQNLTPKKKLDTPVSVKKVKQIKKVNKSKCEGYRLVDMEIMQAIISPAVLS